MDWVFCAEGRVSNVTDDVQSVLSSPGCSWNSSMKLEGASHDNRNL